jgi:hypothetical protein
VKKSEDLAEQHRQAISRLYEVLGIPSEESGYSLLELIELASIALNAEYERAESLSEELYRAKHKSVGDVMAVDEDGSLKEFLSKPDNNFA